MDIKELIGRTISNIYIETGIWEDWLDTAFCYIELDNDLIIGFPNGYSDEVEGVELNEKTKTIFGDLSDYPVYYVNEEGKSIKEMADSGQKYKAYKVEYKENKLKYIQNRKVVDFFWYEKEAEKGYLELDNGYIITETNMSPGGTGLAGLNYYESIDGLTKDKGNDYIRVSNR
jgi:hypothetical protein